MAKDDGIYIYKDGEWVSASGTGNVKTVNQQEPDELGNVDLGNLATQEYVDNKIGDVDLSTLETKVDAESKLVEAKEYTDTKISEIPEVDLSALETKEDATAKLTEAKAYTDTKTTDMETTTGAQDKVDTHANNKENPHEVTKEQVGLENVDDIKQMPISGGTFTGIAKAHNNANYTVAQIRNIIYLEDTGEDLDNSIGNNGDMLVVYEAGE